MSEISGTAILYPNGWQNQNNVWVAINGFASAGYSFNLSGTICTANGGTPIPFSASNLTGMGNAFNAAFCQVQGSNNMWPITINWTISSGSPVLDYYQDNQYAMGSKKPNGKVIAQFIPLFINDSGSDNDWNDLVVFFQVYDQSN